MKKVLYSKEKGQGFIMKGLIVALIMSILSLNLITINASESHEDFIKQATILKELGLFKGSNSGFELNKYGTRVEAAVIIVRLLGVETFATTMNYEHPYTDVPSWANPYVGYLYHEGLTNGIGSNKYGSSMNLSPNQFLTFALRSLSYNDSKGDFNWKEASDKALELRIIDLNFQQYLNRYANIYRDDMVAIMYNLLNQKMNTLDTSLIDYLIEKKVITLEKAIELDVYKQVRSVTVTGVVVSIDQTQKAVITETINDYNYYVLLPFGDSEEIFSGVIRIKADDELYECILTKKVYASRKDLQDLRVGQTITIIGEFATNVLVNDDNTRYIFIQ